MDAVSISYTINPEIKYTNVGELDRMIDKVRTHIADSKKFTGLYSFCTPLAAAAAGYHAFNGNVKMSLVSILATTVAILAAIFHRKDLGIGNQALESLVSDMEKHEYNFTETSSLDIISPEPFYIY